LFIWIELLDFKGEDLFEDGGIIRRIKRKGEGYSNPNEGATVESKYCCERSQLCGRNGDFLFKIFKRINVLNIYL